MAKIKIKTEAQWQAESDAQTLISAEQIRGDGTRLKKAKTAARTIAKDAAKAATRAKKVAGKKASRRR